MENTFKGTDKEWFAVNFGGYINIQDGPKYEDNNILDQEKTGEEVADANAQLMIHALPMLSLLQDMVSDFENTSKSSSDILMESLGKAKKIIKSATEIK